MLRRVAAASLAVALAGIAAAPSARAEERGVAARVNGAEIGRERLERYFEERLAARGRAVGAIRSPEAFKAMKREALDELVDRELLWQEARRRRRVASDAELEGAMARFRAELPDPARRRIALERAGFSEPDYAEYVRRELSVRRLVERDLAPRVKVASADVRAFYQANPERFAGRRETDVREEIRAELRDAHLRRLVSARVAELRAAARIELLLPLREGR